jgi:hypothetical protein
MIEGAFHHQWREEVSWQSSQRSDEAQNQIASASAAIGRQGGPSGATVLFGRGPQGSGETKLMPVGVVHVEEALTPFGVTR